MSHMSEDERKEALKEADVLKMLDHHNIIKYHEHYKTRKGRLHIVMDFAEGKNLLDTGYLLSDAIAEYVSARSPLQVKTENRIVRQ